MNSLNGKRHEINLENQSDGMKMIQKRSTILSDS